MLTPPEQTWIGSLLPSDGTNKAHAPEKIIQSVHRGHTELKALYRPLGFHRRGTPRTLWLVPTYLRSRDVCTTYPKNQFPKSGSRLNENQ